MANDPWASLERVKEALQEKLAPLGVTIHDWTLRVDAKTGIFVLLIDSEAFLPSEEREMKKQFEEMMSEQARYELHERQAQNRQTLIDSFTTDNILDVPPGE